MSAATKVRLLLLTVPLAVLIVLRNYVLPGVELLDKALGVYFAVCLFGCLLWAYSVLTGRRSHEDTAEMTREAFKDRIYLP